MAAKPLHSDLIVELLLDLGRLLLKNGAETDHVRRQVVRLAGALGREARLIVTAEALLLTIAQGDEFRTKVGRPIAGFGVNMDMLAALDRAVDAAEAGPADPDAIAAALGRLEARKPLYPAWSLPLAMGVTGGCLARLFGGDGLVLLVAVIATAVSTVFRQLLIRLHAGPVPTAFVAACAGGLTGGIGMRLFPDPHGALCLVAPAMLLVPGVSIINGIRDVLAGDAALGVGHLGSATLIVFAIAFGLFAGTLLTGVDIPVIQQTQLLGVPQDAVFSALAVVGFCCLFSVPARIAWACAVCGLSSHTLRTALVHLGVDIAAGTMIAALAAGALAAIFARIHQAPPAAFAFPGVLPMVPGSYAFHAFFGSVEIMHLGDRAPPSLLAATSSLTISTVVMSVAIAIGLALPLSLHVRGAAARRDQPQRTGTH